MEWAEREEQSEWAGRVTWAGSELRDFPWVGLEREEKEEKGEKEEKEERSRTGMWLLLLRVGVVVWW